VFVNPRAPEIQSLIVILRIPNHKLDGLLHLSTAHHLTVIANVVKNQKENCCYDDFRYANTPQ